MQTYKEVRRSVPSMSPLKLMELAAARLLHDLGHGNIRDLREAFATLGPYAPIVLLEMANTMTPDERGDLVQIFYQGIEMSLYAAKPRHRTTLFDLAALQIIDQAP